MHEILGRVPDQVADRFLGIDAKQMLQYAEEWNGLWCVGDLTQDRIEDVKVQIQIDALGHLQRLGFVAFSLTLEHVELLEDFGCGTGATSGGDDGGNNGDCGKCGSCDCVVLWFGRLVQIKIK